MTAIKLRREVRYKLPTVPNFILMDGARDGSIDIAEFTPEELHSIAKAWTEALLAHAERRREEPKP